MKVKISAYQLFSIIVLIPYGSAVLFFITPKAKQDAWIAMLIYTLPAIILQLVYTSLWKKFPKDTIVTYLPKIMGKVLGYPLSIVYTVFFAYESARVLRDITSLITITVLPRVSNLLIAFMLTLIMGYACYLGVENISRVSSIILALFIFFFALEYILLLLMRDTLKFYNLKPILENGIISVTKEGWKLITFPFGETVLCTMFFPYVVEVSKVRKAAIMAVSFMGLLLSLNTVIFIAVLGVDFASTSLFPLLQTLRIIKIGETFDRFDIFIILIMIIGGFIKTSLFTYGAMLGTAQLTKMKDTKYLAIPFSAVVFITSLLIAKNYPQHIYIGQVLTLTYIHLPLAVIIPLLILIVYYARKAIKK